MTLPNRYGQGLGPYRLIEGSVVTLSLKDGGVNVAVTPAELEQGQSPNAVDVRFGDGGVSTDYGISMLGSAFVGGGDKTIIGLAEFTKKNTPNANRLVRFRPTGWDRWNGAAWVTLSVSGSINGIATDRVYHTAMQDRLVVANKVDKLKSWNGLDGSPIEDLSDDAPIAWFITPIGNRLMAARITLGGENDPYGVAWSADGNITNWTSASIGAGKGTLEPEIRGAGPDFIMGLSAVETAAVLLRQRSIVLGVRTGIGAAPFRFTTVVFGLGTEAPYTVANTGHAIGVIFLGNDLNVYLFDTRSAPVPIGDPIRLLLRSQVQDPMLCVGGMDFRNLEYWLLIKRSASLPDLAWCFSVKEYITKKQIVWRRRDLAGFASIGFSKTALQATPLVNDVTQIVNTVGVRVNDFGLSVSPERIVFGDANGGVSFIDEAIFLGSGVWESRMLGVPERATMVDKTFLLCQTPTGASVEISISTDGGLTWKDPKVLNIQATAHPRAIGTWFNRVYTRWQYRLRILSGNITISEIRSNVAVRGPSPA